MTDPNLPIQATREFWGRGTPGGEGDVGLAEPYLLWGSKDPRHNPPKDPARVGCYTSDGAFEVGDG